MIANYEYSCTNRENLQLPTKLKLSEKASIFCCFFSFISGIYVKFPMFSEKKEASSVKYFSNYCLQKMCLLNSITGLVSESPFAINPLTSLKNSWNLQKSTLILLFNHSEPYWVRKSYLSSDVRFSDSLITRWLLSTSILAVIERIYSYQFK